MLGEVLGLVLGTWTRYGIGAWWGHCVRKRTRGVVKA